jgi:tripartite-type tricarboxylate transporter receptor subunit TctC
MIESGFADVEMEGTLGIVAPAGTSKEIVSQLSKLLLAALRAPGMQTKLATQGLDAAGMCGTEFGTYLRRQYDAYGRIIQLANIRMN